MSTNFSERSVPSGPAISAGVGALIDEAFRLHRSGQREDALRRVQLAVSISPADPTALNTRGMILDSLGHADEALQDFLQALRIRPDFADAINNRGILYARAGQFEQALACYERSLSIAPDQSQTLYNRAMARLALGDWRRGFREFESRWGVFPHEAARLNRLAPIWLGQFSVAGKTVLLHHEQGYGDTLQFSRYVPLVMELAACVIVAVPAALRALMESLPGRPRIVSEGERVPQHDYCCSLMSLPLVFGTTPERVPAGVPYLRAEPADVKIWRQRLGNCSRARIGLAWSGRRYPPINYPRDMSLEVLRPLLEIDADFVCLQTEVSDAERGVLAAQPNVFRHGESLKDFADTAALIENLDLVITVDTAVAHLAGALGKPVWLMNRYASCWRWLQKRPDSPWYPSMRLFRQQSLGDWNGVVREVRRAADTFISQRNGTIKAARNTPVPFRAMTPPNFITLLNDALAQHRQGRLSQAVDQYRQVLAHDPVQPEALHYLGVALAQQGQYEEAEASLARAVDLQPEIAATHNHYGNVLAGLARYEEAVESYERAIELNGDFANAYYNRAVALMELHRHELAIASYRSAIAIDPNYVEAFNNLGNVLSDLDRWGEALGCYEQATMLRPDFVDAWANRANLLRRLGKYDDVLASVRPAGHQP